MQYLDALISQNPKKSDYLNLRGNILLEWKKPDEALAVFRRNLRHNPHQATAYVNAGRALAALDRFDQAEILTKEGIGLEPDNLKTYIRLLDIYLKQGDHKSAGELSRFLIGSATANDIRLTADELAGEPFVTKEDVDHMLNFIAMAIASEIPIARPRL